MEKTLTTDELRSYGFVDNAFWKDVTERPHFKINPDVDSVVRITESHTERYRWYVEIETWNEEKHRCSCTGHINTLSELERMYDFCELTPSWK